MNDCSISKVLNTLRIRFAEISDTPDLDAQVLLAHFIDRPRAWILAHPEQILSDSQINKINSVSSQIEGGIPLPYVLGTWEFFGHPFTISPDVLIPRPETELLVEKAIIWLDEQKNALPDDKAFICDVGCGSGCIGISLALHHPTFQVLMSDISFAALQVASKNAKNHAVTAQTHFIQCDLIPPSIKPFDLICANLPYIPSNTLHQLKIYQKEPSLALDGGPDGLDLIARLLETAPHYLSPDGLMLIEIEATQGKEVIRQAISAFANAKIEIFSDLAGHDRLIAIQQG